MSASATQGGLKNVIFVWMIVMYYILVKIEVID